MSTQPHEETYTVRVHDEPDGTWWAEVDELPGLFTSGHDRAELIGNLTEAMALYLSGPGEPVTVQLEEEPGAVTELRLLARTAWSTLVQPVQDALAASR